MRRSTAPAQVVEPLLEAAEAFARAAGQVTLRYFGRPVDTETKSDGTPVTRADREAERLIRDRVHERFPHHGFLGEEYGETGAGAPVRWIVDPIDGTRSFVTGVPLFGVLIGVEMEGEPVVGVAHFPALDETVSAGSGLGCRWSGGNAGVRDTDQLGDALVLTTALEWAVEPAAAAGFGGLARAAGFARTWGDAYGHALVATGRADVMVDPVLSPWDAAPLLTLLTEAGGRFTDLEGRETIHGGSGISSNGVLHDRVLDLLTPDPASP